MARVVPMVDALGDRPAHAMPAQGADGIAVIELPAHDIAECLVSLESVPEGLAARVIMAEFIKFPIHEEKHIGPGDVFEGAVDGDDPAASA